MPLQVQENHSHTQPSNDQYPVTAKQAAAIVDGIPTAATSTLFTDKILITVAQDGRLAQWIHVPLDTPNPNFADQHIPPESDGDSSLLPLSHLSPHTLLGGSTSERETVGQLLATQIASTIVAANFEERRTVLLGLGLRKAEMSREGFYDVVDLVRRCL